MLGIRSDLVCALRRRHLGAAAEGDLVLLESAGCQLLEGGFNNGVYRVMGDGGPLCFKFFKVDDRQRDRREWAALNFLRRQGFDYVPRPLHCETDGRVAFLVMEFLEGAHLGDSHLDSRQRAKLVERVRALHAISYDAAVQGLGKIEGRTRLEGMDRFMEAADCGTGESRLCLKLWREWAGGEDGKLVGVPADLIFSRMDTSLGNCLWDGREMRFVDLEYGGWTDRIFDLAEQVEHVRSRGTPDAEWALFVEQFDLGPEERQRFLAAQRLMAFFWASKFWPEKGGEASERFKAQVERIGRLCPT